LYSCPTESIIMSCYLRSKLIYPDKNKYKEVMAECINVVSYKELGNYMFTSNNLNRTETNIK